jgi:hypothetical protein
MRRSRAAGGSRRADELALAEDAAQLAARVDDRQRGDMSVDDPRDGVAYVRVVAQEGTSRRTALAIRCGLIAFLSSQVSHGDVRGGQEHRGEGRGDTDLQEGQKADRAAGAFGHARGGDVGGGGDQREVSPKQAPSDSAHQ